MIDKLNLKWYTDPGHGWLRVPLQAVIDVGIAERISSCSYVAKAHPGGLNATAQPTAYLEEDCDAPAFLAAAGISMETAETFPSTHTDGQSFIRRLPSFSIEGGQA